MPNAVSIPVGYFAPIDDKDRYGAALCFVKPYSDLMRPLRKEQPQCMVCTGRCAYVCRKCAAHPTSYLNLDPASYCTLKHAKQDTFHQLICKELNEAKTKPTITIPTTQCESERYEKQHRLCKESLHLHIKNIALAIQSEGNFQKAVIAAKTLAKYTYHLLGSEHPEYVQAEYMLIQCYLNNGEPLLANHSVKKVDSIFYSRDTPPSVDEKSRFFEFSGEIKFAQYNGQSIKDKSFIDDAISNFSENIVCHGTTYGTKSWQMAYGLWRLGSAFQAKGDTLIANSMFRQSVAIWTPFLSDVLFNKRKGKQEPESRVRLLARRKSIKGLRDEFVEPALANISALYQLWFNPDDPWDDEDIMLVSFAYSMVCYATGNLIDCRAYALQAKAGVNRLLGVPKHVLMGVNNMCTLINRRLSIVDDRVSGALRGSHANTPLVSNYKVGRIRRNTGDTVRRRSSLSNSNTPSAHGSSSFIQYS